MAKKSMIMRELKRAKLVSRQAEKRKALKAIVRSIHSSDEERAAAQAKLNKLPRDGSPTQATGSRHEWRSPRPHESQLVGGDRT
jgi:small subunit ribosomal protein S14